MDGVREIASAFYERASENEKDLAKQYFKKLDVNGDGKISLQEFKNGVSTWFSDQDIFKKLDANRDGNLNFDEALGLYYMEKMASIPKCDGCRDLLVGPYFSCELCLINVPNQSFDLCCACYRGGKFKHHHSLTKFLDHHSMLKMFKLLMIDLHKNRGKNDIKELREIAIAHYRAGSLEVQSLAHKFFDSMDTDGDGKIDLPEFLSYMKQEGYVRIQNPYFFKALDIDGNGTLDFYEVMTIYYIIKSGRPFCDWCGDFIPGIFFSCVECFKNPKKSFNLCRDCYCSKKCDHKHNGRSQFLDNYTLLEAKRDSALARETGVIVNRYEAKSPIPSNAIAGPSNAIVPAASNSNTHVNIYVVHHPPISSSYAIVPAPSNAQKNWRVALRAFEAGLGIGSIGLGIGSIATTCTIL